MLGIFPLVMPQITSLPIRWLSRGLPAAVFPDQATGSIIVGTMERYGKRTATVSLPARIGMAERERGYQCSSRGREPPVFWASNKSPAGSELQRDTGAGQQRLGRQPTGDEPDPRNGVTRLDRISRRGPAIPDSKWTPTPGDPPPRTQAVSTSHVHHRQDLRFIRTRQCIEGESGVRFENCKIRNIRCRGMRRLCGALSSWRNVRAGERCRKIWRKMWSHGGPSDTALPRTCGRSFKQQFYK